MAGVPGPDDLKLKEASGGRQPLAFDHMDVAALRSPAYGLETAGQALHTAAAQWYEDTENEAVADAKLNSAKDLLALEKKIREDPNYKTHVATYTAAAKEIRERGAATIRHPLKRDDFLRDMELHSIQRADAIDKQARATDISHSRAALNRQIDTARSLLSDPNLDQAQREKITAGIGKAIAGLSARPGYLDPEKAHDLYKGFREDVVTDDVMRAARAGDLEKAKTILAAGSKYIDERKRWQLEDHMAAVATKQRKIGEADLDQRREGALDAIEFNGAAPRMPSAEELARFKGPDAPADFAADVALATQKHEARSLFTSMSDQDIDKWVESRAPAEGMGKGTKEFELHEWAKAYASRTKLLRSSDVAASVDGVDYVRAAKGDPGAMMQARLKAQTVAGITPDAQSPITKAEAAELMAEVNGTKTSNFELAGLKSPARMSASGEPDEGGGKLDGMRRVLGRLEGKYGAKMAVQIMQSAVRLTMKHDKEMTELSNAVVSQVAEAGQVRPWTARQVQTHGDIMAAEAVYGRTSSDYQIMPPETAKRLRANPSEANSLIRHYGAEQVQKALMDKPLLSSSTNSERWSKMSFGEKLKEIRDGMADVAAPDLPNLSDTQAGRALSGSFGPLADAWRERQRRVNEQAHSERQIMPADARALLAGKMSPGSFDHVYGEGSADIVRADKERFLGPDMSGAASAAVKAARERSATWQESEADKAATDRALRDARVRPKHAHMLMSGELSETDFNKLYGKGAAGRVVDLLASRAEERTQKGRKRD